MENNFTETELANEVWRDVDGYDGMYQVSDLGRVRSKKYGDWRVKRPRKCKNGYLLIDLYRDKKQKSVYVHRLVASAFIENTDSSKTIINHINEVKTDNRATNLEWCDRQYNNTYNGLYYRRKNYKRHKLKYMYRPDITINENIELFKANGIECCYGTVKQLRKDIGLTRKYTKRS